MKKLRKNIVLANNIKIDSTRYSTRIHTLVEMAKNYLEKKEYDSATYFSKRVIKEAKKPKIMNPGLNTSLKISYLILAEAKFKENKIDSSEFYVKYAQSVPITLGNNEFRTFKLLGEIHEARKEYDSAIVDYEKAIELSTKVKNLKKTLELYGLISEVYEKTGQVDDQKKYSLKYKALNDTLDMIEANNLKDTVGLFVEGEQKFLEDKNNLLLYIILIGTTSAIVIAYFVNKKIRNKNTVLNVKNEENKELNQKLNLAFDEVVQLAKNNSPEFLTRFQEVYPSFFPKLLAIEPQLLHTELKFCALLFLNFGTKDIANYTFVQPESIQTRKKRLRKKLHIPSDVDIYIWIKNL
ncbi:tetratricopeptide repeat protein [Chryseobacterium sp. MEBOG07]|uniref:tetratricopeptide repeat protein n=1 Tax=Chryseobacterium sp. MEBOG07 TaxID=2879939 RepID=UPI001F288774|nr:tetratricopeptide repeat protein [Chryseobacterium sp. MEBOG07]UKB77664.1 tetratricopeptide repeat protein [Chryseobacterium sp. MEBOG07]